MVRGPIVCLPLLAAFLPAGCAWLTGLEADRAADLPRDEQMTLDLGRGVRMTLVRIPAGELRMGSPPTEAMRLYDEHPHGVRITRPFYMAATEVTQAQWRAVMGTSVAEQRAAAGATDPLPGVGDEHPMYYVSWLDAAAFCRRLSEILHLPVRLPTEAEWEYACRAGTTTAFHWGDHVEDKRMNFADRRASLAWSDAAVDDGHAGTAPVGSYPPNAWGLYDMAGNLWEWCGDWYAPYPRGPVSDPAGPPAGKFRVWRGGTWRYLGAYCRSAARSCDVPWLRLDFAGFRVVVPAAHGPAR